MSLVKHGNSGNWYYRFTFNNKIYFKSTKTKNRAQAGKIEAAVRERLFQQHELGEKEFITVQDAFELLRKSRQDIKGIDGKVSKLMGMTVDKKKRPVECYGLPTDEPFDALQTKHIQRLVMARRREGVSDATILHELNVVGLTITLCKNLGYAIPTIDLKKIKTDNKVKPAKGKTRYLTHDEETRLLDELDPKKKIPGLPAYEDQTEEMKRMRQDAYDFTVLLLDFGCRYSELSKLRLSDIHLDEGWVQLYRPKVDNEGVITMTIRAHQVIQRRRRSKRAGQVFLFEDKKGQARQYNPRAFNSACARAGLEGVTLHTMRHTHASRLVQDGLPLYDVSVQLGHTTITMAQRYAHLAPSQSSKNAAAILNKLNLELEQRTD